MKTEVAGIARLELIVTTMRKKGKGLAVPHMVRYVVKNVDPDPRVAYPAYSLTKEDGTVHHVSVNEHGAICDCQDCNYRHRECRHVKGMRAVGLIPK